MSVVQIPGICEDNGKSKTPPPVEMCLAVDLKSFSLVIIEDKERLNTTKYSLIHKISEEEAKMRSIEVSDEDFDQNTDIHCDVCNCFYRPYCLKHPLYHIQDNQKINPTSNDPVAKQTSPSCLVQVLPSNIPNAGLGVFAFTPLAVGIVFGPYAGILRQSEKDILVDGYAWQIETDDGKVLIDGSDPECSNWLRYINSPRDIEEQNLLAFQTNGKIFYRVIKPIMLNEELLVWYGTDYGKLFIPKCAKSTRRARRNQFIL